MVKVYKQNNKLIIYLPFELTTALKLKENDEVDFFRFNEKSFIFAKKEDITQMIVKNWGSGAQQQQQGEREQELSQDEIEVLKKLDTLRYNERNKENVLKLLDDKEAALLKQLIAKKVVSLYAGEKSKVPLYSISRDIYNKYLLRKKELAKGMRAKRNEAEATRSIIANNPDLENESVKRLEEKGFVVLQTEAEAASLSLALEESIRSGVVIGTRSFNKRYYIMLRQFFDNHAPKVIDSLRSGEKNVGEVARNSGIDEEAARGILYMLAESGDVSEKKKDVFELA